MSASTFNIQWITQNTTFNNSSISGTTGVMTRFDSTGSIFFSAYATGGNFGSNSIPGTTFTIGKLDNNSSTVWVSTNALAFTISPDDTGGVVVGGEYSSPPFPGQTAVGATDVVLQKLHPDGSVAWTSETTINGSNNGIGTGSNAYPFFQVANNGNIYGTHVTNGTIPGGTFYGAADTDFNVVIWSLNSNGAKNWAYQLSSFITPSSNITSGIILDNSNNIYITGATNGIYFLQKFNSNGTKLWENTSNINTGENYFYYGQIQPALDGLGNVYVAYYTLSNLPTTSNVGGLDVLVIQLTSNGVFQWGAQMETLNTVYQDSYPSIVGLPEGGVIIANKYVPAASETSLTRIDQYGNILDTLNGPSFNSADCGVAVFAESRALDFYNSTIILYQQLYNGTALPGATSVSGGNDIGFVKFLLGEPAGSPPYPPSYEIRPRCSNASITYYFGPSSIGTTPTSYRLVYNGPSATLSTIFMSAQWGHTQTGLTNGAYYSSFVTAINAYGESEPSYFRVVQPGPFPDPPVGPFNSTIVGTSATLVWEPPSAQIAPIGWYVLTDELTQQRYNTLYSVSTITLSNLPYGNRNFAIQSVNAPGYSTKSYIPVNINPLPFNNLIVWLDAANTSSYTTGSTWSNLNASNGGPNWSLVNNPAISTIVFNGTSNNSMTFNGTNTYVSPDASLGTFLDSNWLETREFWVYWPGVPGCLTMESDGPVPDSGWYDAQMSMSNTSLVYSIWDGSTTIPYVVYNAFSSNAWNHVIWQYSLSTTTLMAYVNGAQTYSNASLIRSTPPSFYPILGAASVTNFGYGSQYYFTGSLAVFRWYNTILSPSTINGIYVSEKSRFGL